MIRLIALAALIATTSAFALEGPYTSRESLPERLQISQALRDSLAQKYAGMEKSTLQLARIRKTDKVREEVTSPFFFPFYYYVGLYGSGDLKALTKMLEPENAVPVPSQYDPTKGTLLLYVINQGPNAIGPYRETILGVLAARKDKPSEVVAYMWDFTVTGDLPRRVGRQFWGYPKRLVNGEMSFSANEGMTFDMREGERMTCGSIPASAFDSKDFAESPNPFNFLTPKNRPNDPSDQDRNGGAVNSIFNVSKTLKRPFDATKDKLVYTASPCEKDSKDWTLHFSPTSPLGKDLQSVGFIPQLWEIATDTQAIVTSP